MVAYGQKKAGRVIACFHSLTNVSKIRKKYMLVTCDICV